MIDCVNPLYRDILEKELIQPNINDIELITTLYLLGILNKDKVIKKYKNRRLVFIYNKEELNNINETNPIIKDSGKIPNEEDCKNLLINHEGLTDIIYIKLSHIDNKDFLMYPNILFNVIWQKAILMKATDIHLVTETNEKDLSTMGKIHFRVGLQYEDFIEINVKDIENLASYLIEKRSYEISAKDLLHIKTETRISINDGSRVGRVSIINGTFGYSVVIRILNITQGFDIKDLNFDKETENALSINAKRLNGLTLVCGTFGSGKGTTINSMVRNISHNSKKKIISIDSPIEYRGRYTQFEYQNEEQLQDIVAAIKKQDIDIVSLNEIADDYVANSIINLLHSGSHIMTTIHSPSLEGIILKLKSVFKERYVELLPYLNILIYQRKFNKPCKLCQKKVSILMFKESDPIIYNYLNDNNIMFISQPEGCSDCNDGVSSNGIHVIPEFLNFNDDLRDKIKKGTVDEKMILIKSSVGKSLLDKATEDLKEGDILYKDFIELLI